jgi:SAM-dependent methyltransferase
MSQPAVDARWSDPRYLREQQYRDGRNLAARANLHAKYGRGDWFSWLAGQAPWPANARILEVGCGTGAFWTDAARFVPDGAALTLTDLSPGMAETALGSARRAREWRSVQAQVADVSALPFETGAFDVVIANHMLYHAPDPAQAVTEIARVLAPGGLAVLATNGRDNMRALFALRAATFENLPPYDEVGSRFLLNDGAALLEPLFASVEIRRYPDELRCTDPADVFAYLTSSPPGNEADDAGRAHLAALIDRAFAAANGVFVIEKHVGVFLCRKGQT